jgi:hypothetical protein
MAYQVGRPFNYTSCEVDQKAYYGGLAEQRQYKRFRILAEETRLRNRKSRKQI